MTIKYRFFLNIKHELSDLKKIKTSELDSEESFALDAQDFCVIEKSESGYNFYIMNDSPRFDEFKKILNKYNGLQPNDCEFTYTEEILGKVEYFRIYPTWRNGYPYYEKDYLTRSFSIEGSSNCDCRVIQTNPVSINRYPKWTNRHFMGVFWLHDIIFCDKRIKELCTANNIYGIEFYNVFFRNNEVPLDDVFQIKITEISNTRLMGYKHEIVSADICKNCNSQKIYFSKDYINKMNQAKTNIESDIFYIGDMFNSRSIIISKKLYLLLRDNKYLKGLDVQPVFTRENKYLINEINQIDSYSSLSNYYEHNELYKSQDENFWMIYPGREKEIPEVFLIEYYKTFLE